MPVLAAVVSGLLLGVLDGEGLSPSTDVAFPDVIDGDIRVLDRQVLEPAVRRQDDEFAPSVVAVAVAIPADVSSLDDADLDDVALKRFVPVVSHGADVPRASAVSILLRITALGIKHLGIERFTDRGVATVVGSFRSLFARDRVVSGARTDRRGLLL